jgi:hypothetical protein
MEQSPYTEAYNRSAGQQIYRLVQNPKIHYCVRRSPPPVHLISQVNTVYNKFKSGLINHCQKPLMILIVTRSGVVITPTSYSKGPGLKSRPGDRLSLLTACVVFLTPSWQLRETVLPSVSFPVHCSLIAPSFNAV